MTSTTHSHATDAADRFEHVFPTLVMHRTIRGSEALNDALVELVLRLSREQPSAAGSSNVGGFHSGPSFLHGSEPCVAELREQIGLAGQAYLERFLPAETVQREAYRARVWGWAIVMGVGDYNNVHTHPQATFSGCYYVRVPTSEHGSSPRDGALVFQDPRGGTALCELADRRTIRVVRPEAGMMVLFPSYLPHFVTPQETAGERVCIAFNGFLERCDAGP